MERSAKEEEKMTDQQTTPPQLKELSNVIIDNDEDSMMTPARRRSSRRQVRPDAVYAENKKDAEFYYQPKPLAKSKREGGGGGRGRSSLADISSSRQLVVYGAAPSASSKRHSCPVEENTRRHRRSRSRSSAANKKDNADRQRLNGSANRDHQIKQHSSSSSRHHERPSGASRRRPSDQSLVSSINTNSTHPSTSNGDYLAVDAHVDYDDYEDGYGHYTAYESKAPTSRTSSRSSSCRRSTRSCSTKSRSRSSSSSQHHHHQHRRRHDEAHRSSYSPVRSRRPPRRPSPENQLRSSFASHGSQRSTRTLPTSSSSSHNNRSSIKTDPVPRRRRSSDDLRALEADDLHAIEKATSSHSHRRSRSSGLSHHRRRDDSSYRHRDHRRSVSSSSSSCRKDDPPADATVNLRVSHHTSTRIIDGKTPRKQNHTNKSKKKKKNLIDLTIDNNGQGTFQVVTSSSTTPLQFDIQIDEDNSSYLIQTSLGLLHQIREVHSPNTNILRTLTYWNTYFERQEVEKGYHRGELGIVSTSSRDMKQSVPVPEGMKAKSTFSKQEVVLMTLTGGYHGGKASSFEKDDVFIKELELFVTDSLWCYLRLHGLTDESSSSHKGVDGGDLSNSHAEENDGNMRNGSQGRQREELKLKNGRKKERVLSRVFKKVIRE